MSELEYTRDNSDRLAKLMAINELAKRLAQEGHTTEARQFHDDFYDITATVGRFGGPVTIPGIQELFPDEESDTVVMETKTHMFDMRMRWGTITLVINDQNELKLEQMRLDDTDEDIFGLTDDDEMGINLMPESQAALYLKLIKAMMDGEGAFERVSEALSQIQQYQPKDADDAEPVTPATLNGIKEALERMVARAPLVVISENVIQLPDDTSEGKNDRFLEVSSNNNPDYSFGAETLNLEYKYTDSAGKTTTKSLVIQTDGACSYSADDYEPSGALDFEQFFAASAKKRQAKQLGLDQPSPGELDELLNLLYEAESLP